MRRRQLLLISTGSIAAALGFALLPVIDTAENAAAEREANSEANNADSESGAADAAQFHILRARDRLIFEALIPVLLHGALADDHSHRRAQARTVLLGVDTALRHLYPRVRDELRQFLDLLARRVGALLLAAEVRRWPQLDHAGREQLLQHTRDHWLALFRAAYAGLHNLVMAAFYGDPGNWPRTGYTGPPALGFTAAARMRATPCHSGWA